MNDLCSQWNIWRASPSALLPELRNAHEWIVHLSVWPGLLLGNPLAPVLRFHPGSVALASVVFEIWLLSCLNLLQLHPCSNIPSITLLLCAVWRVLCSRLTENYTVAVTRGPRMDFSRACSESCLSDWLFGPGLEWLALNPQQWGAGRSSERWRETASHPL